MHSSPAIIFRSGGIRYGRLGDISITTTLLPHSTSELKANDEAIVIADLIQRKRVYDKEGRKEGIRKGGKRVHGDLTSVHAVECPALISDPEVFGEVTCTGGKVSDQSLKPRLLRSTV